MFLQNKMVYQENLVEITQVRVLQIILMAKSIKATTTMELGKVKAVIITPMAIYTKDSLLIILSMVLGNSHIKIKVNITVSGKMGANMAKELLHI